MIKIDSSYNTDYLDLQSFDKYCCDNPLTLSHNLYKNNVRHNYNSLHLVLNKLIHIQLVELLLKFGYMYNNDIVYFCNFIITNWLITSKFFQNNIC